MVRYIYRKAKYASSETQVARAAQGYLFVVSLPSPKTRLAGKGPSDLATLKLTDIMRSGRVRETDQPDPASRTVPCRAPRQPPDTYG
jgi:hypothetical protein